MSAPPKDMNFVTVKEAFLLEHLLMEDEMDCRAGLKEVPGITYVGGPSCLDQANKIAPCMHPLVKSINNFKGKHTAQMYLRRQCLHQAWKPFPFCWVKLTEFLMVSHLTFTCHP